MTGSIQMIRWMLLYHAELPPDPRLAENEADKEQMQELENIVKMNMIHGPCGIANPTASCMQDGKCTKSFPKEF